MRKHKFLFLLLLLAVQTSAAPLEILRDPRNGKAIPYAGKAAPGVVTLPVSVPNRFREMRGIWIATTGNLDFPLSSTPGDFQRQYLAMLKKIRQAHFNAVFFQVRPSCDSFYPSAVNSYSRNLCGKDGVGFRNFDPLGFMVRETHRAGLEYHAWLNPYRVAGATPLRKQAFLNTLSPGNFARRNPGMVLEVPLPGKRYALFLDPGRPEVRNYLVSTVREILQKYPVDAIVFDDYFYLYTDVGSADAASFRKCNPAKMPLGAWRRNNVDQLIYLIHNVVRQENARMKRNVRFGISPFGIWANRKHHPAGSLTLGKESFFEQFADSRKWVKNNWVDYVIPQLYWPFAHEKAAYAALADWWAGQTAGTGCRLFIGHSVYNLGSNALWKNPAELYNQLRYNCKHPGIGGSVLYSYRSVFSPGNRIMKSAVEKILRQLWAYSALPPK